MIPVISRPKLENLINKNITIISGNPTNYTVREVKVLEGFREQIGIYYEDSRFGKTFMYISEGDLTFLKNNTYYISSKLRRMEFCSENKIESMKNHPLSKLTSNK